MQRKKSPQDRIYRFIQAAFAQYHPLIKVQGSHPLQDKPLHIVRIVVIQSPQPVQVSAEQQMNTMQDNHPILVTRRPCIAPVRPCPLTTRQHLIFSTLSTRRNKRCNGPQIHPRHVHPPPVLRSMATLPIVIVSRHELNSTLKLHLV